ncbi:hypothetical protein [Alkalibaculum sporogenes]|uniref:hypothetical protein n=1 Tax=Alkalibaculum sporogenes TaxID=2655001 RepID=UPI001A9BC6B9|nr:hypothetical protein [Alkalibaculum sporogenes]
MENRKVTVILSIIRFFTGRLVMSFGTSPSVESFEYISHQKRGDPERQLDVSLFSNGDWNQRADIVERLSEYFQRAI